MTPRTGSKISLSVLTVMLTATCALPQPRSTSMPNRVDINPRLVTSGQPSAGTLESLLEQGFDAVIYLAPPTVPDAVRDEAFIVAKQGLTFVNVPIKFDEPTEKDFDTVTSVLSALAKRKVLVHCQINLRASSMVFLHRVITAKEDPRVAYDAVAKVWSPDGVWKTLMHTLLQKNGVTFEPY